MINLKQNINLLLTDKNLIEGTALMQLEKTAELPGIISTIGYPDMHPGKGHPVGASFLTEEIIYPYIIGNDIGCGMTLFETDLLAHEFRADKTMKRLDDLESPMEELASELLDSYNLRPLRFENSIGTLGGGNHFAEFLKVKELYCDQWSTDAKSNPKAVYLLIHSGSRGLGESILSDHIRKFNSKGLNPQSPEGQYYLSEHNYALRWAKFNRQMIASRIAEKCRLQLKTTLDQSHNMIEEISVEDKKYFIHRKGASKVEDYAIIPGSRGDHTYLVKGTSLDLEHHFSLPHGAGRKWQRGYVKDRLSHKYRVEDLQKTELGNFVICEDKELLYDEAPQAYKNIERIIDELVKVNAVSKTIQFTPLLTYKKRQRQW